MSSDEEEVVTSGRRPTSGRNRTRPPLADDGDSSDEGNLFDTDDEENDAGNDQQADHTASFSIESLQQALVRSDILGIYCSAQTMADFCVRVLLLLSDSIER
jgi:hypothetical protein